jgi:hypothetical protein
MIKLDKLINISIPAKSQKVESAGVSKLSGSSFNLIVTVATPTAKSIDAQTTMKAEAIIESKKPGSGGASRPINLPSKRAAPERNKKEQSVSERVEAAFTKVFFFLFFKVYFPRRSAVVRREANVPEIDPQVSMKGGMMMSITGYFEKKVRLFSKNNPEKTLKSEITVKNKTLCLTIFFQE